MTNPRLSRRSLAMLVVCAACAAAAPGQVGDAQRSIRNIDFRNYTYSPACVEQGTAIKVTGGTYERSDPEDPIYFEVQRVIYGDLTRDGIDEAVVQTICNTGGTGQFSDGIVFTMRGGKPVAVATLGIGDRADGGIHAIRIDDGLLVVDRYGQESSGACCPEYVESYRLRYDGKRFVETGKPVRRIFLSLTRESTPGPMRVRFLKGTSSAALSGSTNGGERYVLGVRANQILDVAFSSRDARSTVKITTAGGKRLMTLRPNEQWSGLLPESGDITIAIESTAGADSTEAYFDMDISVR